MNLRFARLVLILAIGTLLGLNCAILGWGLFYPLEDQETTVVRTDENGDKSLAPEESKGQVAVPIRSSKLWDRQLRKPLYDPPPPAPSPPPLPPPPTPIQAKLWATMIDKDHTEKSLAVIRLNSGEEVFRKIGEVIGGSDGAVEILDITAGSIRVKRGEDVQELEVEYDQ